MKTYDRGLTADTSMLRKELVKLNKGQLKVLSLKTKPGRRKPNST
jgi:hypothetical protein